MTDRRILAARERDTLAAFRRHRVVQALPFRVRRDIAASYDRVAETADANALIAAQLAHQHVIAAADLVRERLRDVGRVAVAERVAARDVLTDTACDATVKSWARRRASEAGAIAARAPTLAEAFAAVRTWARSWHVGESRVVLPLYVERDDADAADAEMRRTLARLMCRVWWTRAARVMLGRGIEADAIDAGRVHRHAALYVSARNFERARQAAKRNAQMLRDTDAVSDDGDRVNLAQLARGSLSNPWVRFCELMVRIKGLDKWSSWHGHVGLFVTWTLPSRYHARHAASGEPNERHDGSRPRDGQAALCELWARARAQLAKWQQRVFGLRVAEPHHDGTPHWHLMIWCAPHVEDRVSELMRRLALEDSPDEPGAATARCKIERIDSERGAAGYLAKYVAKATNGGNLAETIERGADGERRALPGEPSEKAKRARAWASLHGIRQFQFFGTPPVGIWREARRIRDELTPLDLPRAGPAQLDLFEQVRVTADRSDYGRHVEALGGAAIPRADVRVVLLREPDDTRNRYGEAKPMRISGLQLASSALVAVVTRAVRWVLRPALRAARVPSLSSESEVVPGVGAPWTRGNNCNRPAAALADDPRPVASVAAFLHWPAAPPDWPI